MSAWAFGPGLPSLLVRSWIGSRAVGCRMRESREWPSHPHVSMTRRLLPLRPARGRRAWWAGQQAVPAVVLTGGHLPRGDSLLLASCESGMFPVNEGLCHLGNIFVEFHFISEWDVCLMALCC